MQPLADPTLACGGPRRLLLVDDNPGDARLISEMLKDQWGTGTFDLRVATSLAPALQILQREPPDALLLDLSLPDSWGLDTLRRVQAVASGVASIVLAGQEDHALALEAVKEGAQDYLFKNDLTGWLLVKTVQCASERKRIESRLRISEARFRSLAAFSHLDTETRVHVERFTAALELSADAIFFVDRGNPARARRERRRMQGAGIRTPGTSGTVAEGPAAPRARSDFAHGPLRQGHRALSGGPGAENANRAARRGSLSAEVHLLAIQSGGRWVIVAMMRDLTERKAAQAELELFRAAIDNSSEILAVIDAHTCAYVDANETCCGLLGYRRDELIGMRTCRS